MLKVIFYTRFFLIVTLIFFSSATIFSEDNGRELTPEECGKLYVHQLKVHIDDGLLSAAIAKEKSSLESDRSLQNDFCKKNINYANYRCQLAVRSVIAIHECHKIHGGPVTEKMRKDAVKKDSDATEAKKKNRANGDPIPDIEKAISKDLPAGKVTAGDCSQAYGRLLSLFRDSPNLKNNPDRDKMISYWNSDEAKASFSNRCMRVYRPSDIECIRKGKNRDALQACLLQIPSE